MNLTIRLESSVLKNQQQSGVAKYTLLLEKSLEADKEITLHSDNTPPLPHRVYAKLQSYGLSVPYDTLKQSVDLTIFPNFARWPTVKSKVVATVVHDFTYIHYPELVDEANLRHLRRVVPRAIHKSDFIITVSESMKKEAIDLFGMKPNDIIVTPIPPDTAFLKSSQNEVISKYGIPTEKYIYFIGNFEPRKNLTTLIEAYCSLPDSITNTLSLVIAGGKGWQYDTAAEKLNKAMKTHKNIVHIGYIDQIDSPALYQNADIFVFPSLYEGFGMPILEAMASKVPVVAADIPVLREAGGDAAVYADPARPGDFTDAILSILDSPEYAQSLINRGARNLNRFSWNENVQKIKDKLQQNLR